VVQAGDVHLSALGTEFDLRAWPQAATAELIVRSGRVAVRRSAAAAAEVGETVLSGGERGVVGPDGHVHVFQDVDVAAHLAWTTAIVNRRP
jgi:ferric-dicitrate binding protein FerR (iron transport regulator)